MADVASSTSPFSNPSLSTHDSYSARFYNDSSGQWFPVYPDEGQPVGQHNGKVVPLKDRRYLYDSFGNSILGSSVYQSITALSVSPEYTVDIYSDDYCTTTPIGSISGKDYPNRVILESGDSSERNPIRCLKLSRNNSLSYSADRFGRLKSQSNNVPNSLERIRRPDSGRLTAQQVQFTAAPSPVPSTEVETDPTGNNGSNSGWIYLIIAAAAVVILFIIVFIVLTHGYSKRKSKELSSTVKPNASSNVYPNSPYYNVRASPNNYPSTRIDTHAAAPVHSSNVIRAPSFYDQGYYATDF